MPADMPPNAAEDDIERLSEELRDQVRLAKDRISDRYAKLVEDRSFDPSNMRDD